MEYFKTHINQLSIVHELLEIQRQQDAWLIEIQSSGHLILNEAIAEKHILLHFALDILGVPKDTTMELNSYSVAAETGRLPEGHHSREHIEELFRVMVGKHSDILGFVDAMTGNRKLPSNYSDDVIEEHFYGCGYE